MGFVFGIALTAAILIGAYKYATDPEARSVTHTALRREPGAWAMTVIGAAFALTFFWGIFIPEFGTIEVPIGNRTIELWAAGGLATLVWFVVLMVWVRKR
jgi:hypothetical protein